MWRENEQRHVATKRNPSGEAAYREFHGVEPDRVVEVAVELPMQLIYLGTGVDIGYGVTDKRSEKEGWYVHDFGRNVDIYKLATGQTRGGVAQHPGTTLRTFPRELLVLGYNLGFTYEDDSGRKHEVKGSSRKKLCASLPDKRRLVVVGPRGVEYVCWGGSMRIKNWIYD
jgi:hypothetical protein